MSLKLDRDKFWKGYHKSFDAYGPTTQATVNACEAILDKFETETRLKYTSWYAYCLATAFHETGINGNHFVPVKEGKSGRGTKNWRENQSKYWDTGFYGRGLVQVTWEENYLKVGERLGLGHKFVDDPDLLLDINWAYEAMVIGMVEGMYRADRKTKRRKNLAMYLHGDDASLQDYVNARDIINGDVKANGLKIATYAEKFEHIISAAVIADGSGVAGFAPDPADEPAPSADEVAASSSDLQPPTLNQNAENIINNAPTTPVAGDKTLYAPEKDGGTATAAKTTLLGITVPLGVTAFVKGGQDLIDKGYVSASDIGSTVLTFMRDNQKWVFLLIGVFIGYLALKKLVKQITFWLQILTHAIPGWNNITVLPSETPTPSTGIFSFLRK